MWQEIIIGFCGLVSALETDTLCFRPCMPKEMKSVSFQIIWKGQKVSVTVTQNKVTVKNWSDRELAFTVFGQTKSAVAAAEASVFY